MMNQHGAFDEQERRLRTDLAALYRVVALLGWDDLLSTHISVRLPVRTITSCSTRSACCSRK
jgi:ribulose-5-phosphate 4-epimerase/fuculose-1-phosphate aldolase